MTHPDGEGPIDDHKAAKSRAKAEREKPEHAYKPDHSGHDPRDKAGEADDPTKEDE